MPIAEKKTIRNIMQKGVEGYGWGGCLWP